MTTTTTASKNALSQLIELSFKDNSWDIDKLHTTFRNGYKEKPIMAS